jgi:hypothetical protein
MANILVRYQEETPERARVNGIHYKPEMLNSAQRSKGLLLAAEALPKEPVLAAKQQAVLYTNPKTGVLWWEVEAREPTVEERLADIEAKLDQLLAVRR